MHEKFANWYSLVTPQFDAQRLANRWNAAVAYADSLEISEVAGVARALLNRDNVQQQHDAIRQQAMTIDTTYVSTDDLLEIRVICAGAIAHLLSKRSNVADAIALSVCCGVFQRSLTETFVSDVAELCKCALIVEGRRVRNEDLVFQPFSSKTINDVLKAQSVPTDVATVQANATAAISVITKSLSDYLESANETIARLRTVQLEESDILWWLMGGRSLETGTAFSKTKQFKLALIAAYDLATITKLTPGPSAAEAFLSHVLQFASSKRPQVTLQEAVNSIDRQLKEILVLPSDRGLVPFDLIPCHTAIQKSAEMRGGKGWEVAFSTLTALDATTPTKASALAYQAYMERILVRVITPQAAE